MSASPDGAKDATGRPSFWVDGHNDRQVEELRAEMLFPAFPLRPGAPQAVSSGHFANYPEHQSLQHEYLREALGQPELRTGIQFSSGISEHIVRGTLNGLLAGFCLMYFRQIARRNDLFVKSGEPAVPSRRLVFYLCTKYNLGRSQRAGGPHAQYPKVSALISRAVWERYAPVSHLWAAHIFLKGLSFNVADDDQILNTVSLSVLLLVARAYEHFPPENMQPFKVRYDDWRVDDPFPIELTDPDFISDFVTEWVPKYQPDV